jgi:hypothetical protein
MVLADKTNESGLLCVQVVVGDGEMSKDFLALCWLVELGRCLSLGLS